MQATVLAHTQTYTHDSYNMNAEPVTPDTATWQQLADYRSDIAKKLSVAAARLTTITSRLQHTSQTTKARIPHYAVI